MVVMPGIVNAHDHLDQSVYRSLLDHKRVSRDNLLNLARGLTRERAHAAAASSLLELLQYGVTTTQENHWTHYHQDSTDGICEAIQQSGMRAVVSRGISDEEEFTPADFVERTEDVLEDLDRLEAAFDSDRIMITSEPTTIIRCKPETVRAMKDWALKRDKMWHIHLAQTSDELAEAMAKVGMGSVQYAEKLGVLGPEMLAIHCSGLLGRGGGAFREVPGQRVALSADGYEGRQPGPAHLGDDAAGGYGGRGDGRFGDEQRAEPVGGDEDGHLYAESPVSG